MIKQKTAPQGGFQADCCGIRLSETEEGCRSAASGTGTIRH